MGAILLVVGGNCRRHFADTTATCAIMAYAGDQIILCALIYTDVIFQLKILHRKRHNCGIFLLEEVIFCESVEMEHQVGRQPQ